METEVAARITEIDDTGKARLEGIRSFSLENKDELISISGWIDPGTLGSDRRSCLLPTGRCPIAVPHLSPTGRCHTNCRGYPGDRRDHRVCTGGCDCCARDCSGRTTCELRSNPCSRNAGATNSARRRRSNCF